jgi:hypothetical protein
MMRICHHAAFSSELRQEWDKHQSLYFKRWRAGMTARKKLERLGCAPMPEISSSIDMPCFGVHQKCEMRKDEHLIILALQTDKLIASNDDTARRYWQEVVSHCARIGDISWVNPTNQAEQAIVWLQNGAPSESHRQLGHHP